MRSYPSFVCAAALASMSAVAGIAQAADPNPATPATQLPSAPSPTVAQVGTMPPGAEQPGAPGASLAIDGMGPPVDPARLAGLRGGDDTTVSTIVIEGTVTDNHAQDVVSGSNTIAGGAFGNSAGVSSVIQNSGANVLIQNATIINVQFTDPGP